MKTHIFVFLLACVGLALADDEDFKSIRVGEDLQLKCVKKKTDDKVEGDTEEGENDNEDSENVPITWYREIGKDGKAEEIKAEDDNRITINNEEKTLLITKVEKSDMGKYKCKVDTNIINSWEVTDLTFRLKKMKPSYPVDIGASTNNLDLNCVIKGQANVAFLWFVRPEGEEDKSQNKLICVNEDCSIANNTRISAKLADIATRSVLHVKTANKTDRQLYTCRVVKQEDASSAENVGFNCTTLLPCFETEALLRVKDPLAAVYPFVGIVIEVVVLCIIIFVCERRRGAKEAEELEEDEGYNGNNAATSNSNIRQRK